MGLDWQTCITHFLCRRRTPTTWTLPFSRFMEDVNTKQQFCFSFPELKYSPLEFNSSKKITFLCRIERDGINAINFEARWIHFLSDISCSRRGRCCLSSLMLGYNRTVTRTNIQVLFNIEPGVGGEEKRGKNWEVAAFPTLLISA